MHLNADRNLSPQTIELLEALLLPPVIDTVSEKELAKFILKDCSPSELEILARRISQVPESQAQLVKLWREYRSIASLPLASWPRESVFFQRAQAKLSEAGEAWSALGRNLRMVLSVPRFAVARGAVANARLHAEISEFGALDALMPAPGVQDGRLAKLKLIDPLGGHFTIAIVPVEHGSLRFHHPSFGSLLSLQSGPLPSELFVVDWDGEEALEAGPRAIWAVGPDGEIVPFELAGPPQIENGQMTLRFDFAEDTSRDYLDHRLALLLPLGEANIELASVNVTQLIETKLFVFPIHGVPDGTVPLGSMIRARLVNLEVS